MSGRYLIQIEAHSSGLPDEACRTRLATLGIAMLDIADGGDGVVIQAWLVLGSDEHQVDAHQAIKRVLGAAFLRTRWLDLDETQWGTEISDPRRHRP